MPSRILKTIVALACFASASNALADCAGASLSEVREAYDSGLKSESAGKLSAAFGYFVTATEPTCEPNPIEADAARRAAAIGQQLGGAAEKKKDYEKAFHFYDGAGHYAAADRALMAMVRANPDKPSVYQTARSALEYRALPAFQSNNATRLKVTGAYQFDPKMLTEVLAMPAKGAERAFTREAAAFNEQYLRELVALTQSTPDDLTDFEAVQVAQTRHQAFAQKWKKDPIEMSRKELGLAREWASAMSDKAAGAAIEARRNLLLQERVAKLTKEYSGAPKILEAAIDYQLAMNLDDKINKQRVTAIRTRADKLGDEARTKGRLGLAAEYYSVANQSDKAQAARDEAQQRAMAKMQPSIEAMQKQAAAIQAEFSDPEKVKAMQAQAEAMRKKLEQQQKTNAATNAKRANDLEAELGL